MIARPFIKAKYITLVNLLADAELMPEYLTERDVSDELVRLGPDLAGRPGRPRRATANLAAAPASGRPARRIPARRRPHRRVAA